MTFNFHRKLKNKKKIFKKQENKQTQIEDDIYIYSLKEKPNKQTNNNNNKIGKPKTSKNNICRLANVVVLYEKSVRYTQRVCCKSLFFRYNSLDSEHVYDKTN